MSEHRAIPHAPALTLGWGGLCVLALGVCRERKIHMEGKTRKTFQASKFSEQTKEAQDAYLLHHSLLGLGFFLVSQYNQAKPLPPQSILHAFGMSTCITVSHLS